MHIDPALSVAGLVVGLLVGLTGMGGGALMTPLLVLVFGVQPLAAISSDLVTSLVMKPVGAVVHLRRRTVQTGLLGWLALGAVPAGFLGAMIIGRIGHSAAVQHDLKIAIGVALVGSVASTVIRLLLDRRAGNRGEAPPFMVRPGRTVAIGVIGGFAVGMTSVGAGSLVIALLLLAYPRLKPAQLVGTDIVQAIPLVGAAALGHLLFGDVQFGVTASLLVGALPGVYVGARLSAQAPAGFTRPVLSAVLLGSALALLSVPMPVLVCASAVAAAGTYVLGRPPTRDRERRDPERETTQPVMTS